MAVRTCLLLLVVLPSGLCLSNGVGRTPSMGWNTWNAYHSDISEAMILQTAGFMVNMTLVKAGYDTIVLDGTSQLICRLANGIALQLRGKAC